MIRLEELALFKREPKKNWAIDRSAMARNIRLTREKLERKDDLILLSIGTAIVIAKTGEKFKLSKEDSSSAVKDISSMIDF